jgi:hypothetical protein
MQFVGRRADLPVAPGQICPDDQVRGRDAHEPRLEPPEQGALPGRISRSEVGHRQGMDGRHAVDAGCRSREHACLRLVRHDQVVAVGSDEADETSQGWEVPEGVRPPNERREHGERGGRQLPPGQGDVGLAAYDYVVAGLRKGGNEVADAALGATPQVSRGHVQHDGDPVCCCGGAGRFAAVADDDGHLSPGTFE